MLRCASSAFSSSALATIVRNFHIGKRRPPRPVRFWENMTGPGDSTRIAMAQASRIGAARTSAVSERATSRMRLATR